MRTGREKLVRKIVNELNVKRYEKKAEMNFSKENATATFQYEAYWQQKLVNCITTIKWYKEDNTWDISCKLSEGVVPEDELIGFLLY